MPRKRRTWIPEKFYHIVSRGNRRDPLFYCSEDFEAFFHILHQLHETHSFELASYCLMTNHFHLQLRSTKQPISKVMSLLNKRFANYFNTRYNVSGHVFEKRFFAEVIYDYEEMLRVSRYIHLNPVAAHMVDRPELYPWSSYSFYHAAASDEQMPPYMNLDPILVGYSGTQKEQEQQYCEMINDWLLEKELSLSK
ncbi:transposase [Bacillus sp. REN10]|uniref:transposase n=1 Tax=Bacillus sp. REN10 TaxID=2782541 RepID=UPI00193C7C4C|nr:transposase [Bacillus sp. REN10]